MVFTGATPPNPATFDPLCYTDWQDNTKFDTNPPPFYDDGTAGSLAAFAAKKAALAVGGTSVDHEGLGTEVVVTITTPNPNAPLIMVSCLGNYTATPNSTHGSSLTPATPLQPTASAASGASNVSGIGTTLLTVTGTNFNRTSVVYLAGVPQQTNYVSATSLTVTSALKRTSAGTLPVYVVNGSGGVATSTVNWTLT
jgi:hypothetical protein